MKIIKISALWCPSCIIVNNIFNKIKNEYNLNIVEYDYDLDEEIVSEYNVGKKLPVIIACDDNDNELDRIIGEKTKEEFIDFIEKYENN